MNLFMDYLTNTSKSRIWRHWHSINRGFHFLGTTICQEAFSGCNGVIYTNEWRTTYNDQNLIWLKVNLKINNSFHVKSKMKNITY